MRPPQKTAALKSLHVPVGATAIGLAASIAIQNAVVVWTGAPSYADPITEVLAWHAENRVAVEIAVGLEALNLPLLLGFLIGLHSLVGRRGGAGADWSRLAVAAGAASRRSSPSTPSSGTVSCCPPASSPSRAPCSSSSGSCTQQRSRWRCRRSAPPSSAPRWQRTRAG